MNPLDQVAEQTTPAEQPQTQQDSASAEGAGNVGTPTPDADSRLNAASDEKLRDMAAYEAARRVSIRKQERLQIAALILAGDASKETNVALAADKAIKAAEALLDRNERD